MTSQLSRVLVFVIATLTSACAGLQKEQIFTCSYDTVWNAAVDTMKDRPVARKDKESGIIETAWTEMAIDERGFGAFGRPLFDSKERARLSLELKNLNEATKVSVSENRQRWHARGGVTQQAVKWSPVEPSQEAMTTVMRQLSQRVSQQGCPVP